MFTDGSTSDVASYGGYKITTATTAETAADSIESRREPTMSCMSLLSDDLSAHPPGRRLLAGVLDAVLEDGGGRPVACLHMLARGSRSAVHGPALVRRSRMLQDRRG